MDTEILTMDHIWCKGLMNQSVSTLYGVRSEYDDDDDYNLKGMAHYRSFQQWNERNIFMIEKCKTVQQLRWWKMDHSSHIYYGYTNLI